MATNEEMREHMADWPHGWPGRRGGENENDRASLPCSLAGVRARKKKVKLAQWPPPQPRRNKQLGAKQESTLAKCLPINEDHGTQLKGED